MLNSLNRLRRDRRGAAAIEFGLLVPLFMMFLLGAVEFGRVLAQSNAVEKGVRAGVSLAVRSDNPMTAAQTTSVSNLVRYGNTTGTAPYLVDGWSDAGATVVIKNPPDTYTVPSSGEVLTIVEITATVPYTPLVPGLFSFAGLSTFNIVVDHEQAYIGN